MPLWDKDDMSLINGKTVLVVDDMKPMRNIVASQLREAGAGTVLQCTDGVEALATLAQERVDLILSDWHMPRMSGLELLEAVRKDPGLAHIPFLMITAETARDQVRRAIESGVSAFLVKPYSSARFLDRLDQAMHWTPRRSVGALKAPAGSQGQNALAQGTVLVVDDTPANLQLLTQLLREDYRVKIATNGEKALAICQGDDPPDLVLLDVMMPGLDGFEVLERMRLHPNSQYTPVVFVSALTDDTSRARGLDLGAVDFVPKPVDPSVLRMRVRNFMRYVDLRRQLQADYDEMLEVSRLRDFAQLPGAAQQTLGSTVQLLQAMAAEDGRSETDCRRLLQIAETLAPLGATQR